MCIDIQYLSCVLDIYLLNTQCKRIYVLLNDWGDELTLFYCFIKESDAKKNFRRF